MPAKGLLSENEKCKNGTSIEITIAYTKKLLLSEKFAS